MPGRCSFKLEIGFPQPLAGVDEAGCAPLAGPVVAAACILDRDKFPRGIDDSKNLPLEKRESLYARITKVEPAWVLVDGNATPRWQRPSKAIVDGDAKCRSIAAASIIAKVTRDRMMVQYAEAHPGYGWEHNRGYPTPDHRRALRELGPTPLHRRSFGLVRDMIAAAAQPELQLAEIPVASPLSHTTIG